MTFERCLQVTSSKQEACPRESRIPRATVRGVTFKQCNRLFPSTMGTYAGDIVDLFPSQDSDTEATEPLGTRLRGQADDVEIDSVDAVRDIRERL
jgi:hypothetical protein